eukprot:755699-Hanusia_phi.AAC.3
MSPAALLQWTAREVQPKLKQEQEKAAATGRNSMQRKKWRSWGWRRSRSRSRSRSIRRSRSKRNSNSSRWIRSWQEELELEPVEQQKGGDEAEGEAGKEAGARAGAGAGAGAGAEAGGHEAEAGGATFGSGSGGPSLFLSKSMGLQEVRGLSLRPNILNLPGAPSLGSICHLAILRFSR